MSNLKKALAGLLCTLLLGFCAFGPDFISYVVTGARQTTAAVKSKIPVEFEIQRAKDLLAQLTPEIQRNQTNIAHEEIGLANLQEQIATLEDRQERDQSQMMVLKNDLQAKPDDLRFVYVGRTYSRSQVETDLANRFSRFQINENQLDVLKKTSEIRHKALEAAKTKLQDYSAKRNELLVQIQQLESRQNLIAIAKSTSKCEINDSQLGQLCKTIDEVKSRLDVEERLLDVPDLTNEVQLDAPKSSTENIAKQVDDYFNSGAESVATSD